MRLYICFALLLALAACTPQLPNPLVPNTNPSPEQYLYWVDGADSLLLRTPLDNPSAVDTLLAPAFSARRPGSALLHSLTGELFFTDVLTGELYTMPRDGGGPASRVDGISDSVASAQALALNYWRNELYVADGGGTLWRCSTTGGNVAALVTGIIPTGGLAIDTVGLRAFWPENNTVQTAPLTGGAKSTLLSALPPFNDVIGFPEQVVYEYTLDALIFTDANLDRVIGAAANGTGNMKRLWDVTDPLGLVYDPNPFVQQLYLGQAGAGTPITRFRYTGSANPPRSTVSGLSVQSVQSIGVY